MIKLLLVLATILQLAFNSTVTVSNDDGYATAWFIDSKHLITCKHVTEGNETMAIKFEDESQPQTVTIVQSEKYDVSLLTLSKPDLNRNYLKIANQTSHLSDEVFAIGTTFQISHVSTFGFVAREELASNKHEESGELYQCLILPAHEGLSGSPVIDSKTGEVDGMVSESADGFTLAVPCTHIREFLKSQGINY